MPGGSLGRTLSKSSAQCAHSARIPPMVGRILVGPLNLLNNMVKVFANTGNTLPPSNLRTPFGARHESIALCRWGVFHPEIRSGCLTPAFSGAQKRVEMLCPPYILVNCESLTPTQGATQQNVD